MCRQADRLAGWLAGRQEGKHVYRNNRLFHALWTSASAKHAAAYWQTCVTILPSIPSPASSCRPLPPPLPVSRLRHPPPLPLPWQVIERPRRHHNEDGSGSRSSASSSPSLSLRESLEVTPASTGASSPVLRSPNSLGLPPEAFSAALLPATTTLLRSLAAPGASALTSPAAAAVPAASAARGTDDAAAAVAAAGAAAGAPAQAASGLSAGPHLSMPGGVSFGVSPCGAQWSGLEAAARPSSSAGSHKR